MPTPGPFNDIGCGGSELTVSLDADAIVSELDDLARAQAVEWDGDSKITHNGELRAGVDYWDIDDDVVDAVCGMIAARDAMAFDAADIDVKAIHIEPESPCYVDVIVDE